MNCYGKDIIKSSAVIYDVDGRKYFGVSIYPKNKELGMTSISNAICNAVSSGSRVFSGLTVYVETLDDNCITFLLDSETVKLLKEFKIKSFQLINSEGKEYSLKVE